jgi:hypothetical protein
VQLDGSPVATGDPTHQPGQRIPLAAQRQRRPPGRQAEHRQQPQPLIDGLLGCLARLPVDLEDQADVLDCQWQPVDVGQL